MKRTWLFLLAAALVLVFTGSDPLNLLPYAREIDEVELMRTLGVDRRGGEGVTVTLSGGAKDGAEPVLMEGQGDSLSGALLSAQGAGDAYIFYGHVGQLLLGEELAAEDARAALDYVLRDVEMRLDTNLYLARASAGDAIRAAAGAGKSAADRLEAMEENEGLLANTMSRTVGEVLNDLEERGAAFVPALRADDHGLEPAGYAILKGGALVGWAEGDAARGVNLYQGRVDADVLELELAALRVVGAKSSVRPVFEGERLTGLEIVCRTQANLVQASPGVDLADQAQMERLTRALEEREDARLRAALTLSQTLNADYLGLKQAAGLAAPWHRAEIQAQWNLPALTLRVTVEGKVERGYDLIR